MRIFCLGAGALGSLFAARVQSAGGTPTLFGLNIDHVQAVAEHGLRMTEMDGTETVHHIQVCRSLQEISSAPDVVLVLVKAYATQQAVADLIPFCHQQTVFVTLQNGMGNWENIAHFVPRERILAGVTAQAATMLEPGHIRHGGNGPTIIGPVQSPPPKHLNPLVSIFKAGGLDCRSTEDVFRHIWAKLFVNIGINAITALSGVPNGWIAEFAPARSVAQAAVREAMQVARARGVTPEEDTVDRVMDVAQATAVNRSSMLQDVCKQVPTEIEAINGIICRWGRESQVPTPVNSTLYHLIQTIEHRHAQHA